MTNAFRENFQNPSATWNGRSERNTAWGETWGRSPLPKFLNNRINTLLMSLGLQLMLFQVDLSRYRTLKHDLSLEHVAQSV